MISKKRIELGAGNDELHQLADSFNDMFDKLDRSFEAERQFTSDASHELRTPVSVIAAQCELSLEKPRSPEEYEEALRIIQRQSRKMSRLIGDMLEFTRLEVSLDRYRKENFNFTGLVESVCTDMALIRGEGDCPAARGGGCDQILRKSGSADSSADESHQQRIPLRKRARAHLGSAAKDRRRNLFDRAG